jgi:hypothetical protein
VLSNVGLNYVIDAVDDQPVPRLLFLFSKVPTIEPRGEDLLGLRSGHWQGDASIGTDGVFSQPRASAGQPIHDKKNFTPCGCYFDAKARQASVPIDRVFRERRKAVDCRFRQADTRNRLLPILLPQPDIGSTQRASTKQLSHLDPYQLAAI